jgi:2-polyprenyl-6-methoxyphenol hydroxylase-like FAD-dependent oxidoreductase
MVTTNNPNMKKIVILGGGTAGWMAANLLQHYLAQQGFTICLIESPDIPTVGVGEGSTPQLRQFFNTLGIAEQEWMSVCNATYKNGISFVNWSDKPGFEEYFHPFPSAPDRQTAAEFLQNCMARRRGYKVDAHPNRYFLSATLAQQSLSPKPIGQATVAINYAYHFDSVLLGKYLSKIAIKSGVNYIQARCDKAHNHANGEIKSIELNNGEQIEGDLFIDCSGFRSVLLQQHLAVKFNSYQDVLFNDSAIAMPSDRQKVIQSQTLSSALSHGWTWQIPLTNRTGNGYVYSSEFISADQAEQELRTQLGLLDDVTAAKRLSMKIGRVEQHWAKNCLAVGLSQGFIEPLEATALHLVQETIESFVSAFTAGKFTQQHQQQFNQRLNARFDGIRDYIVCHYKVNSRHDTDYWRANRDNSSISESLKNILQCWDEGGDITAEINRQQIAAYYPAVSWHCLLAGYGRFPEMHTSQRQGTSSDNNLQHIDGFIQQCASGFKTHLSALKFDTH